MSYFIQRDLNDPTKLVVKGRTRPDKNTVAIVPDSILVEDHPYLRVDELPDPELVGVMNKVVSVDQAAKDAALAASSKAAQVDDAYKAMVEEVYAKVDELFHTRNDGSAAAHLQALKEMVESPDLFSGKGLKVQAQIMNADNTELYDEGALLDTDAKITAYAERKLQLIKEYGAWRLERIQQFRDLKTSILGA